MFITVKDAVRVREEHRAWGPRLRPLEKWPLSTQLQPFCLLWGDSRTFFGGTINDSGQVQDLAHAKHARTLSYIPSLGPLLYTLSMSYLSVSCWWALPWQCNCALYIDGNGNSDSSALPVWRVRRVPATKGLMCVVFSDHHDFASVHPWENQNLECSSTLSGSYRVILILNPGFFSF